MKIILCFLACLTSFPLLADYTYVWSGNDPRFSGTFSISDADFTNRDFTTLTAVDFQFHDSQDPSHDVILSSPLNILGGGNNSGSLTSDGLHLNHNQNAFNPNVSFAVSAWQHPSIDVGLYSWNPTGDSLEYFEYANYTDHFFAQTTGSWSLQVVPEPSTVCLVGIGSFVLLVRKSIGQTKAPDGAANRSQPVRSETNQPSAAAGSGR